jgi:CarD family transcriptional regulator
MYNIGDKIVYPMHGAGVVVAIEDRTFNEEVQKYYVLRMPIGDMKITVPCASSDTVGIREVISRREIGDVKKALKTDIVEMKGNWNKRYRDNMDKLKTGNLTSVCEVVRSLMRAEQKKRLSAGEKKMLTNAKHILMSELMLVSELSEEDITIQIETLVFG